MKSSKILPEPALVATGHEDLLTFTQFWKMITSSHDLHKGAFDDHHKVLEVFNDHQFTGSQNKVIFQQNRIQRQQGLWVIKYIAQLFFVVSKVHLYCGQIILCCEHVPGGVRPITAGARAEPSPLHCINRKSLIVNLDLGKSSARLQIRKHYWWIWTQGQQHL